MSLLLICFVLWDIYAIWSDLMYHFFLHIIGWRLSVSINDMLRYVKYDIVAWPLKQQIILRDYSLPHPVVKPIPEWHCQTIPGFAAATDNGGADAAATRSIPVHERPNTNTSTATIFSRPFWISPCRQSSSVKYISRHNGYYLLCDALVTLCK